MTNRLLQSERLVIESFLKQASALLTMIENIDYHGASNVVKSATSRDVSRPDEFDEVLDGLFHAGDDFRSAKRALKRAVAKIEYALEVDADRKDKEANRRSQEARLDELVERWEAELAPDTISVQLASPVRAVNAAIKRSVAMLRGEDAILSAYRDARRNFLRKHGFAVGVAPQH
ncbi:hypothetical protein [Rhizobium laguerreae]|uniref:hypothetical protein n=1 Tax=Rhizobium laguerreae TaxID=1076926 RepID=UPI001C92B42B|nr:hypothetical protein [Rhizobium laguerreae]MBY3314711.1 hypothetical protein [Rhizobium laguerreae]